MSIQIPPSIDDLSEQKSSKSNILSKVTILVIGVLLMRHISPTRAEMALGKVPTSSR